MGAGALTFDVADGRSVGLLDRDLAALLHVAECVCGLRKPRTGRVLVDDVDLARSDEARASVAVNLSRAAHSLTSLGEHVGVVAAMRGKLRMPLADGIARLGLDASRQLNTPAAKSAAALLCALLPDARAVVLHDPFRDLDHTTRDKAITWIRALADSGASLLITGAEERDVRAVSHSVIEAGAGR